MARPPLYDPYVYTQRYAVGQFVSFRGNVYECIEPCALYESPDAKPTKWRQAFSSSGAGTVTSVAASISGALSVSGSPITTTGTLAFSWTGNNTQVVLGDGTFGSYSPGGGTVTSFSAGNLSQLFTTSVANPATTPALTFAPVAQTPFAFLQMDSAGTAYQWVNILGSNVISVTAATTTTLPAFTYNNGVSGVGATITINAVGALPNQDGVALAINDTLLVKDESSQEYNGVYYYSTVGNGGTQAVLTRSTNSDTSAELTNQVVIPTGGTVNKNVVFSQQTDSPTIGTDPIVYDNVPTPPSSAAVRLNKILAANATNSINSKNYAQAWNWNTLTTQAAFTWTANALSTGSLFVLSSTSTAGDASKLLQLTRSGANAGSGKKNYGLYSAITNTGTTSTNVAGFFSASGGTTNYGIQSDSVENLYRDSIGVTSTDSLYILNNTAAAAGAQQWSPRIRMRGNSWKTAATAATQTVDWIQEVQTFRGLGNAKGRLTFSASQNGGAYTRVAQLTSGGGLILGNNTYSETSGANQDLDLWLVTGQNNNVTAYGNETVLVYGRSNTTQNSTFCIGLSNSNYVLNYMFGNSNTSTTGVGSHYIYGDSNNTNGSGAASYIYGGGNTTDGSITLGKSNTNKGSANSTGWSLTAGAGNTISGAGGTGLSHATGGMGIFGWNTSITPTAFYGGNIIAIGVGMTFNHALNGGTFNFGNSDTTGQKPNLQFRAATGYYNFGFSNYNQLLQGTDVTQTGFDQIASNVYILKEAPTLSGTGTITGTANAGGSARFTISAGITGMATGEKVVITGTTSYNGTYYVYMDSLTTFRICTTRAAAFAGTPFVAYSTADASGTVTPQQRTTDQVISDTVVYYVNSLAAGQASPHWYTEDGGIFTAGTARVGWRSNTNLVLCANDTAFVKILTSGSVLLQASGALATSATDGFTYIPTCAGTPTGVPTTQTGMRAMVWDSTNFKLYIYDNSTWNAMN